MKHAVVIHVNGTEHEIEVSSTEILLDSLRRHLHLFGVREACGIGMCGACTVLVEGQPLSSCLLLTALCDGQEFVTVEGLAGRGGSLHPVQQAFLDYNAFQCSYCTPGFILAATALLAETPDPSPVEVRTFLAGNLCRCASYLKIEDAVIEAGRRLRGEPANLPTTTSVYDSFDPLIPASPADRREG